MPAMLRRCIKVSFYRQVRGKDGFSNSNPSLDFTSSDCCWWMLGAQGPSIVITMSQVCTIIVCKIAQHFYSGIEARRICKQCDKLGFRENNQAER